MRVKTGTVRKAKHKKILKSTKGYHGTYRKTYKRAHEAYLHAGQYSYIHRRKRLGVFRRLWIKRLSNALKAQGLKYSTFIHQLKGKNIELNRKILSEIAANNPEVFSRIAAKVK